MLASGFDFDSLSPPSTRGAAARKLRAKHFCILSAGTHHKSRCFSLGAIQPRSSSRQEIAKRGPIPDRDVRSAALTIPSSRSLRSLCSFRPSITTTSCGTSSPHRWSSDTSSSSTSACRRTRSIELVSKSRARRKSTGGPSTTCVQRRSTSDASSEVFPAPARASIPSSGFGELIQGSRTDSQPERT